jgi:PAS domain-containing protein
MSRASSLQDPASLRDRTSLLELVWLMTTVVVLMTVALPWFFHALDIDLKPIAWSLFGFAAVFVLASRSADNLAAPRSRLAAAAALHGLGILMLAAVWHLTGGVGNTPFLILFALPVVASGLMGHRALPYGSAVLAIASVAVVAVGESSGLRWYLARLGLPLDRGFAWLVGMLERESTGFFGSGVPPSLVFVTLIVFASALVAVAFVAESLTSLLQRLYQRLATSSVAREDVELLYNKLLQGAPDPSVVLFTDSAQLVQASDSFVRDFLVDRASLSARTLFDLIDFSYPDMVREILAGGALPFVVYRVDGETRVGSIHAWRTRHAAASFTYLVLRDVTDLYHLQVALDAIEDPYLLIANDGRLVYLNTATRGLFNGIEVGQEARVALAADATPAGWWDIGLRRFHGRQAKIGGRSFDVSLSASPLPGEVDRLTVARLRAAGGED